MDDVTRFRPRETRGTVCRVTEEISSTPSSSSHATRTVVVVVTSCAWWLVLFLTRDDGFWWALTAVAVGALMWTWKSDRAIFFEARALSRTQVLAAVVVGVALAVGSHIFVLIAAEHVPVLSSEIDALTARLNLAPGPRRGVVLLLIIAVTEDVVWRGLFPRLFKNARLGHALSVTGYAAAQSAQGSWLVVLVALFIGAILSVATWRTRAIGTAVVIHVVFDLGVFVFVPLGTLSMN